MRIELSNREWPFLRHFCIKILQTCLKRKKILTSIRSAQHPNKHWLKYTTFAVNKLKLLQQWKKTLIFCNSSNFNFALNSQVEHDVMSVVQRNSLKKWQSKIAEIDKLKKVKLQRWTKWQMLFDSNYLSNSA